MKIAMLAAINFSFFCVISKIHALIQLYNL
jgi:hypothetical protein